MNPRTTVRLLHAAVAVMLALYPPSAALGAGWMNSYGGFAPRFPAYTSNGASQVRRLSDGGFLVAGYRVYRWGTRPWLMRLDASGEIVWERYVGDRLSSLSTAVEDPEGGLLAAGWHDTETTSPRLWVLSLTDAGEVRWQNEYGAACRKCSERVAVAPVAGGCLVAATARGEEKTTDLSLMKLDRSGKVLWRKVYGGEGNERADALAAAGTGCILAGVTDSLGFGEEDAWLARLDGDGNPVWQKTYGGELHEAFYSVVQLPMGGYAAAGYSRSFSGDGSAEAWIARLGEGGELIWERVLEGGTGSYGNAAADIRPLASDGFVVGGRDSVEFGSNGWLLRLTAGGESVWQRRLPFGVGSMDASPRGEIVAAGRQSGFKINSDAWVGTLGPSGDFAGCRVMPGAWVMRAVTGAAQEAALPAAAVRTSVAATSEAPAGTRAKTYHECPHELTIILPRDHQRLDSGDSEEIFGLHSPETAFLRFDHSLDGGGTWQPIEESWPGDFYGEFDLPWTVPVTWDNTEGCLLRAIAYDNLGLELERTESPFAVDVVELLTPPRRRMVFISGMEVRVDWHTHATALPVDQVIIRLTKNRGATWRTIATLEGNPGFLDWEVPPVPAPLDACCKFKVILEAADGTRVGTDISDRFFSLVP